MNQQDEDEESIEYWKAKYEDLNNQYDEYQKESSDLEHELELQLKQSEERIKDYENKNNRLHIDNETLKNRLNEVNTSTHRQISQLQEDLAKSNAVKEEMHKYIRELEQKNDDLERTNRCAMFSLAEFEAKINEALERNAILESELDEKDELAETVQRLRDESRDLRQELAVRQKKEYNFISSPISSNEQQQTVPNHNNSIKTFNDSQTAAASSETNNQQQTPQLSLKSSTRNTALNYVGDVLRKITSMESKLLASRNFVIKEPNKDRRSFGSAFENTNMKLFKRESIIPNVP